MLESYALLVERISSSAKIPKEEIERRIEARRAKLSGLISKEGAAQIIAAELGISFDSVSLKISELMPGMKKVNVTAKVINIFPVRSFEKNGRSGKVANLVVADETGNSKVVLWDTNHISLIENKDIKSGDVVEIRNGSTREGEIHLSGFSELKKSSAQIQVVKTETSFSEKTIDSLSENAGVLIRGTIVQMFAPRFFSVCSQCGKKVMQEVDGFSCNEHGKVLPKERALLNLVLDDGTETLRTVIFSDQLEKMIPLEKLKDPVQFEIFKNDLLGAEVYVKGMVRKNQLFNNLELSMQDFEKVDPEKLIEKLEKA
jgi:ssDNA-binding replication factor A large subunit